MKPIEQFSDEDLLQRYRGLAKNMLFVDGRLYVAEGVRPAFDESWQEIKRRNLNTEKIDDDVIAIIDPLDQEPIIHSKAMVRYAKKEYLEKFIRGRVSFGHAGKYDSLENLAQRDNEMKRVWHGPNSILTIGGVKYPAFEFKMSQEMRTKDGKPLDYHFLSFSSEESAKLQRAFDADSYVIIHDYNLFCDILGKAISMQASKLNWVVGPIKYYDEKNHEGFKTSLEIAFGKSIQYKYQHEVRVIVRGNLDPQARFELDINWPEGLLSKPRSFNQSPAK